MVRHFKRSHNLFKSNRKGASYAISAVIITATTIVLVLIASSYAYQILDRQRGESEFEIAQKSMLTFDDALRDVAWSLEGSRYSRFTMDYGQLTLMPNDINHGLILNVTATVDDYSANYWDYTGYVKYAISTRYVTFGNSDYSSYILGDSRTIVTDGTESLGRLVVAQESDFVSSSLTYRVKAMESSRVNINGKLVSYVDIWIIKLKISNYSSFIGDLDLIAKADTLTTTPFGPYSDLVSKQCNINVQLGNDVSNVVIPLSTDADQVVFNFIVSEVEILP
ncbi:MAG: hypothetical protein FK734_00580 [Asgard group archaeon]|nr:hypothetical protein [Asgard group archaeon]